ncbi:MAG: lipoate--protein ligase family protein [Armatimonadetes bacterium]|nr:lipoate--protein ligase family protein [Armatimonadota bacterium]
MSKPTHWRLICSLPANGAWNMAVDEAMLLAGVAGLIPPTLRFYAWEPATVSLGFFQPLDERIDLTQIAARGFGLVRRPSGGRAILHKDELTYSVVVPEGLIPDGRSVMGSYRTLSRGIEAGLRLLGLGAEMPDRRHAPRLKAAGLPTVCFAASAGGDMVAGGRKIVGSAQTRRGGVIMQHGSVPIHMDPAEHLAVMPGEGTDEASQQRLLAKACGVADALGRPVSFDELAAALRQGFEEHFGITFEEAELTEWETAQAQRLSEERYATRAWTDHPAKRGEESG